MLTAILMVCVAQPSAAKPDDKPGPKEPRVYAILIHGNIVTKDGRILDELDIFPGQVLPSEDDLKWAEIRLLIAFQKRFDLINHVRPRVLVRTRPDSDYHDVW